MVSVMKETLNPPSAIKLLVSTSNANEVYLRSRGFLTRVNCGDCTFYNHNRQAIHTGEEIDDLLQRRKLRDHV